MRSKADRVKHCKPIGATRKKAARRLKCEMAPSQIPLPEKLDSKKNGSVGLKDSIVIAWQLALTKKMTKSKLIR